MRLTLTRSDLLIAGGAALMVLLYQATAGGRFPLDDAWIFQTYARNLAQTGQWAYFPGIPSAAATSPLYTILLAVGYWVGLPFIQWTHGLGILTFAATAILAGRMAERLAPQIRGIALLVGLAYVITWHLIWAAASGMDTMLFCLFSVAIIAYVWREQDSPVTTDRAAVVRGAIFGLLSALTFLTRPEGILLVGLVGLGVLVVRPQGSWRRFILWSVVGAALFLVAIAPYMVYNVRVTGGLLPDTANAKRTEYIFNMVLSFPERFWLMVYPLIAGWQMFLLPGAVYFAVVQIRKLRADRAALLNLLPLAWTMALLSLYAAWLPINYHHGRYVLPSLSTFILCGVVGTLWVLRLRRLAPVLRIVLRAAALSGVVMALMFALVIGRNAYRQDVRTIEEEMVTAAQWIAANIPPEDTLAVHDIGAVGYFAPRPIIDTGGLVTPGIVPIIRENDARWAFLEAHGVKYLMALDDQIPGQNLQDDRLCKVFTTHGTMAPSIGQPNINVYAIHYDGGGCP